MTGALNKTLIQASHPFFLKKVILQTINSTTKPNDRIRTMLKIKSSFANTTKDYQIK